MLWYNSTADEINSSGIDTAILPIGSTEQHGPHLPIITDTMQISAIAEKVAEKIGVFLLPTLPISTCIEHMGKKGSIWMNAETFYRMMDDIVSCLKQQGFKRVIILQGHGGVFILGPFIREYNAKSTDTKVIRYDIMNAFQVDEINDLIDSGVAMHACEFETSLMLYLAEEFVRKELIEDCVPDVPRDFLNYGSILKFSKNGVWGKPSYATKEKGEKIFNLIVNDVIKYIEKVEMILDN